MSDGITKTVQSFFGPKEITREEFIKQWKDQFTQFFQLSDTVEEFKEFKGVQHNIERMAARKWDMMK